MLANGSPLSKRGEGRVVSEFDKIFLIGTVFEQGRSARSARLAGGAGPEPNTFGRAKWRPLENSMNPPDVMTREQARAKSQSQRQEYEKRPRQDDRPG
jgi:hypothetical protein